MNCYLYDESGFEVARKQLPLEVPAEPPCADAAPAKTEESEHFITFTGTNFRYTFSKHLGTFVSIEKNGTEQLAAPLRITALRAPMDNERKFFQHWWWQTAAMQKTWTASSKRSTM